MTSTRDKGQQYVREAMKLYKEAGFECWKPGNRAIWIPDKKNPGRRVPVSQSQDIFERFDIICTSQSEIHWVQVKSDESDACRARQLIDGLPMPSDTIRVVMMRIDGKAKTFKVWVRRCGDWTKPFVVSKGIEGIK